MDSYEFGRLGGIAFTMVKSVYMYLEMMRNGLRDGLRRFVLG